MKIHDCNGVLDSRLSSPSSSPDQVICDVFLGKYSSLTVSFSSQEYKMAMVTDKLSGQPCEILAGNLQWTSIPSRGSSNTSKLLYAVATV